MNRKYPNWIKAYMDYSAHSEAPDKFHFWTAVSTVAGALRRRVWIDQGYFQWTPNFYIIFVSPPGIVSKSTTLSIGMRLLKKVKGIYFGPDAVTWQSLIESLAESTDAVQIGQLFHEMSCITIASSEFGTFLNPKDREMVDVLVSLWDGQLGVWEKRTKTQGSDQIANPWINIAACTTPAWIAGNFPDYMIGGGFTSRCVWVYADQKRRLIAYPGKVIPEGFEEREKALVYDLTLISKMSGEFSINPEATEWGENWYREHYENPNIELSNSRFAGYIARKQTHIHKLAMVLSAAESGDKIITKEHLQSAEAITSSLEDEMPLVFRHIGGTDASKNAQEVVQIVFAYGEIPKQKLARLLFNRMGGDELTKALEICLTTGLISSKIVGGNAILKANHDKAKATAKSATT